MTSPNKHTSKPSRVAKMSVKPIWRKKTNICNTSNVLNSTSPIPKPLTPHHEPSQENNHPNQTLPNPHIKDTSTSPLDVSHSLLPISPINPHETHTQFPPQSDNHTQHNQTQHTSSLSPSRESLVDDINQLQDLSNLLAMHLSQQQNNIPSSPYSPNLPHTLNIDQVETHSGCNSEKITSKSKHKKVSIGKWLSEGSNKKIAAMSNTWSQLALLLKSQLALFPHFDCIFSIGYVKFIFTTTVILFHYHYNSKCFKNAIEIKRASPPTFPHFSSNPKENGWKLLGNRMKRLGNFNRKRSNNRETLETISGAYPFPPRFAERERQSLEGVSCFKGFEQSKHRNGNGKGYGTIRNEKTAKIKNSDTGTAEIRQ
ncbi:hypothetical protein Tco_0747784 [Tanacetum coccineum]|uniref:Uncharacterized protein n=1 Tax=Tanacetum coccineum TaxID=301880 RepID=A0ABQ4YWR4_9ASTR